MSDKPVRPRPERSVPTEINEKPTVPVDLREMQEAAKRSRLVPDPTDPKERRAAAGAEASGTVSTPSPPCARVELDGAAGDVTLPALNLSPTGVVLEVPLGTSLALAADTPVRIHLDLGPDAHGAPLQAGLRAVVAHCREGRKGKPGGLALRWDASDPETVQNLSSLLERARR